MTDLEKLDQLIAALRTVKTELKRRDRMSKKLSGMDYRQHTPNRIQKANNDLNWQCMELDKAKVTVARLFKGSLVDVGTEERTYRPSGFHEYRF